MAKIIVINIGSRSKKYSLFEDDIEIIKREFEDIPEHTFDQFTKESNIDIKDCILAFRIVAPGKYFTEHRKVDNEFIENLKEAASISPLHIKPLLKEVEYIKSRYPKIQMLAISDSAFHKSIPNFRKIYALPKNIREKYGIEKQGYHGISLSSIVRILRREMGEIPEKLIVCHLGGGGSITALHDGLSIDTSMGWTVLDGIPMAERIGSIDPGVLAYIGDKENLYGNNLENFLSTKCGLEAISGINKGDMRQILLLEENDQEAKLALDTYIYSIQKYIGMMAASLGGCDSLILTGSIAERSPRIRWLIAQNLQYLNINIHQDKNKKAGEINDTKFLGILGNEKSIIVIPTDENREIAIETINLMKEK